MLVLAVGILLGLTWVGLSGGLRQLPQSVTTGQKAQSAAQIAYGVLSLLMIASALWRRQWALVQACWVASTTVAGGLAPVVWGGSSLALGLLSAGATLLIALGTVWLVRRGVSG
jgi:hypothetical protein